MLHLYNGISARGVFFPQQPEQELTSYTPWLDYDAPSCLSRAAWKHLDRDRVCVFSTQSPAQTKIYELELKGLSDQSNSIAIDMSRHICQKGVGCPLQKNQMVLFMDDNHITTEFSRHLSTALLLELRAKGALLERDANSEN